jgi:NDP-sugar pyrophosphorylase family protein
MRIEISREDVLLDTGGGLKQAAWFFLQDSNSEEPFIVHNVDVISTIDLDRMVQCHTERSALATLAVQNRQTSRYLLFDENNQLCGRRTREQAPEMVRAAQNPRALAFSGIHVISPRLLKSLSEDGVFSIITSYLRLAGERERIQAFNADQYYWRDLGKPDNVTQAEREVGKWALPSS